MSLKVDDAGIQEILNNLKSGKWLVPKFQREFVWSEGQIISLIESIIQSRPIGMTTLWSQADESDVSLTLEAISLPDRDERTGNSFNVYYKDFEERPKEYYAILDGRQRCTAIAIAFGGFRQTDGKFKFAGQFFLNVSEKDPSKQIVFVKTNEIRDKGLDKINVSIGKGYFPLALSKHYDFNIFQQWLDYVEQISNPGNYTNNELPDEKELNRRKGILKSAFDGINSVKLAVYIVPNSYDLDVICDIFETLNTSGTTVSTVDLIHSALYNDTVDWDEPILLRDWMSEMSDIDGAIGWISKNKRPELTAQIVTGSYIAMDKKDPPRAKNVKKNYEITSIKSSDLLNTPATFYKQVIDNQEFLALFMADFQGLTSEGYYPYNSCPYPITVSLYVALRWTFHFESEKYSWSLQDLNLLFSAFFWRTSVTKRYDQGVLTQFVKDLKLLKSILNRRATILNNYDWVREANSILDKEFEELLTKEQLVNNLLDGRLTGAFKKSFLLPVIGRATVDLLNPNVNIAYPDSRSTDLHHIYPKSWCKNNATGDLKDILGDDSERDSKNSVANLMPLHRSSNKIWKAKVPKLALSELGMSYKESSSVLNSYFIDETAFELLNSSEPKPMEFWTRRAELIADYIYNKFSVTI